MQSDPAGTTPTKPHRHRTTRVDNAAVMPWGLSDRAVVWLSFAALAIGFVIVGVDALDLGPEEARLGLAAGGSVGPLGQVFGYWALDMWPGEVWPSIALAGLGSSARATAAVVRWPAAVAAILAGWLLVRGTHRALGHRAAIWAGICWFGCLGVIDRSAGTGLDMILGVATLGAIERLLSRGADWVRRTLGRAGVPRRRLAAAGLDRPDHHRHRPAWLVLLRGTRGPAAGDRRRLVDCRDQGGLAGGVCVLPGHAAHSRDRRTPAAGRRMDGAALDAVRGPRRAQTHPGRLVASGPGVGQGLASGRSRLRHRGDRRAGPGIARAVGDPGRTARRGGGRPRFGLEARVFRRPAPVLPRRARGHPGALACHHDLRLLPLDREYAVLPGPGDRRRGPGARDRVPGMVGAPEARGAARASPRSCCSQSG